MLNFAQSIRALDEHAAFAVSVLLQDQTHAASVPMSYKSQTDPGKAPPNLRVIIGLAALVSGRSCSGASLTGDNMSWLTLMHLVVRRRFWEARLYLPPWRREEQQPTIKYDTLTLIVHLVMKESINSRDRPMFWWLICTSSWFLELSANYCPVFLFFFSSWVCYWSGWEGSVVIIQCKRHHIHLHVYRECFI